MELDVITSIIVAVVGIALLMGLWVGIQEWERRHPTPLPEDCEKPLADANACGHCPQEEVCATRPLGDDATTKAAN